MRCVGSEKNWNRITNLGVILDRWTGTDQIPISVSPVNSPDRWPILSTAADDFIQMHSLWETRLFTRVRVIPLAR